MQDVVGDDQAVASRRIADEVAARIESGELPPGYKLQSERKMVESYGVARNTVQAAMRLLAESGLVVSEHGRGVFVRRAIPLIRLGSDRYSPKYRDSGKSPFLLECDRIGKKGSFEVLSIDYQTAPDDVASSLRLDAEASTVLVRDNVFYADADPVYCVTTYIPAAIAKGTGLEQAEVPHQYGIHGVLEDQGYRMARLRDTATARMPSRSERAALRLSTGIPVIDLMHISVRDDGVPYEATRFVMRGDMSALSYDAPIE